MTKLLTIIAFLAMPPGLSAQAFYGDPPDSQHPCAVHDGNRPQPPVITPGTPGTQDQPGRPPSDALVLFDGTSKSLDKWTSVKDPGQPTKWIVKDGALQCVPGSGYIRTKEEFGDGQYHVEWCAPEKIVGSGQARGNSGVFLMGKVEIQVLDNYQNPTYPDGTASAVYGTNPPMVNALRPSGEWQTYDIIFRRPVFDSEGKPLDPGRVTVLVNGVVTQECTPFEGPGGWKKRTQPSSFGEKGPIALQDHGNPVRYRNIWYRPLARRAVDGGLDGRLDPAVTTAKRRETAAILREKAAGKSGLEATMLNLESLCYASNEAALAATRTFAKEYLAEIGPLGESELDARKRDICNFHNALAYLRTHKLVDPPYTEEPALKEIITRNGLDKQ